MPGISKPTEADSPMPHRVLVGMDYPNATGDGELRAEPGDIVADLPAHAIKALLELGYIEKVD